MADTFDADQLRLSKDQIIGLMDSVRKRWLKNKRKNIRYIVALTALKTAVQITPDMVLQVIWGDLVRLTNEMISYNAMQRLKGEMPKTADMVKIAEEKIESGDLFE